MPFKSEKQRRYLWKFHPALARKWANKYGSEPIRKHARKKGVHKLVSRSRS